MTKKIHILPSNLFFDSADKKTILEAALDSSITIGHSCKIGECGTCIVEVISGKVRNEHGQIVTTGNLLSCCSFAVSNVVLKANYYPELAAIERKTLPCRVNSISNVTNNIVILTLRLPSSQKFEYLSGQYIVLTYQNIKRSYSIANVCHENNEIELHIKKIPHGQFSNLFINDIKVHTLMHLCGPNGSFFVRKNERPIIFLACGTGFAPIKAMIEALLSNKTTRNIHIYWGMSTPESFYSDLPKSWTLRNHNIKYIPIISKPHIQWSGRIGFVQEAVLEDFPSLLEYEVYACGSRTMIDAARSSFLVRGLDASNFYSDVFAPAR